MKLGLSRLYSETWPRVGLSMQHLAGISLIAAAIAFSVVFSILAARMGYPDVLNLPMKQVYPRLIAGGESLRSVWWLYAFIPFALLPAGLGAHAVFAEKHPLKMQLAWMLACWAALFMFIGLVRWPTAHWVLAQSLHQGANGAVLNPFFDAINLFLGNVIGEFAGEMALAGYFGLVSWAMLQEAGRARWLAWFGVLFSLLMMLGAWRNAWPAVQPITDFTNYLLPIYMIALGLGFLFNFSRTTD